MVKILLALLLVAPSVFAEDEVKLGLSNESSLGYVLTGGNSESETASLKHSSTYTWTSDILRLTGHYIQSSGLVDTPTAANPTLQENKITAENWSAALRFEHVITPNTFNMFVGHGWMGDRFQGVREGHSSDIGVKYFWENSDSLVLFSEAGYRYTRELLTTDPTNGGQTPEGKVGVGRAMMPEYHYVRLFSQIDYKHSKTLTLGAWVEYTPSIVAFSEDQRINYSPYLTSVLSDMFSLKVAYEGRYRYKPAKIGNKLTDYTFTTSLLATF